MTKFNDQKEETAAYSDKLRAVVPWIFAGIILIGYGIFIVFMINKVTENDQQWVKLSHILGSIEAIVFTAVGFIFGAEVNRTRAVSAENNEKKENKEKRELANEVLNKIPQSLGARESVFAPESFNSLRSLAHKYSN